MDNLTENKKRPSERRTGQHDPRVIILGKVHGGVPSEFDSFNDEISSSFGDHRHMMRVFMGEAV